MAILQEIINNDNLTSDLQYLLDHKNNWKTLVSVYDTMDSTTQYTHVLSEICKKENLDEEELSRNARPFRYFLSMLVLKNITEENFKNLLQDTHHDNLDEFIKFMVKVNDNLKPKLLKLKDTQIALQHHEKYFLDDITMKICNTVIKNNNIPFILLDIDDNVYQCTIKDIKILINKLNSIVKECD